MLPSAPIGVFDSGVGGLTVLKALQETLPHENLIYLGDSARVPYGTKGDQVILRYTEEAAQYLVGQGIKLLVVACNTAASVALEHLQKMLPIPVVSVIEPGVQAACTSTKTGSIGVIATEVTIHHGLYRRLILEQLPNAFILDKASPLLVPLAEECWVEGNLVEPIVRHYLQPFLNKKENIDCLVLGCTHFPLFKPIMQEILGNDIAIIDSALTTAHAVKKCLLQLNIVNQNGQRGEIRVFATDLTARFEKVADYFFRGGLRPECFASVELDDLSLA